MLKNIRDECGIGAFKGHRGLECWSGDNVSVEGVITPDNRSMLKNAVVRNTV